MKENKQTKKLILVDANALMHRAYHALPPLVTKKGENVNAVYGFTSVLLKVVKDLRPDYIICAFDVAGGTFRDKIYDDYKAGRAKPDQEFYDQIPKIKEVVEALNIPIIERKGFEADDVIGTLAEQANGKLRIVNCKLQTIIVTGDMDALQLVDKNTEVYTLRKGIKDTVIYDEKAVEERYGLKPEQIIDFKGLRGDPSDNIPGVKGIGEKGASELLQNFGSIKKLYEAIEKNKTGDLIKPRTKEKLIAEKSQALMSKELATIKRDMDIKLDLEKCVWGDYNKERLNGLFRELEFYSLISRVEEANGNVNYKSGIINQENNKKYVRCVVLDSVEKTDKFLAKIEKQKQFVFRTISAEKGDGLKGLLFSFEKGFVYYIPIVFEERRQSLFNLTPQPPLSRGVLEKIKPILEDENYKKTGYFFKHDIRALQDNGINIKGLDFDILIAAYLLNPGKRDYSEDKIIFDYLGHSDNKLEKEAREISDKVVRFSRFFELREKLKEDLKKVKMENLFYKIEMPLIKILAEMEKNGVKLDVEFLKILSSKLKIKILKLGEKIYKLAGDNNFNINSSQQLSRVLFEKMRLPAENIKRTQTGYSVAAPELDKLKDQHIIVTFISEYKEFVKLKNTYVDVLPKLVSKKTGRLHTTFHQAITATGRLSSSNPNLQNIPIRTEIGREIRKAFIAESGRKLLSADYSQIELRIIAMIADDKKMKEIFNEDLDIHIATASEVNQVSIEKVTAEMRRAAKALNFGVIYGMSVFGFARSAGIEKDKAKEFIENYMEKFSGVAEYIEKSKRDAKEKGCAETLFGRRRYLPELNSSNAMIKNSAERMAINMPIQGTAADIMKIAMIKIDKWMKNYNNKNKDAVRLLLQVHDELLFSVQKEKIDEVSLSVKEVMENRDLEIDGKKVDFPIPIKVDLKTGDNWEEMKKL
ncbi:MAG: DNA polymerase I [Patescibacteria group bacterium]|nr:DNA polymerase I [Patescibacteria group bacterium]